MFLYSLTWMNWFQENRGKNVGERAGKWLTVRNIENMKNPKKRGEENRIGKMCDLKGKKILKNKQEQHQSGLVSITITKSKMPERFNYINFRLQRMITISISAPSPTFLIFG